MLNHLLFILMTQKICCSQYEMIIMYDLYYYLRFYRVELRFNLFNINIRFQHYKNLIFQSLRFNCQSKLILLNFKPFSNLAFLLLLLITLEVYVNLFLLFEYVNDFCKHNPQEILELKQTMIEDKLLIVLAKMKYKNKLMLKLFKAP